jgi:hypothetical protein
MGNQHQATVTHRGSQGQLVETFHVDSEKARNGIGDFRRVQGADERKKSTRAVCEAGDSASGIACRMFADTKRRTTRAKADNEIAGLEAEAKGGGHVVACPGSDDRIMPMARNRRRIEYLREHLLPRCRVIHQRE